MCRRAKLGRGVRQRRQLCGGDHPAGQPHPGQRAVGRPVHGERTGAGVLVTGSGHASTVRRRPAGRHREMGWRTTRLGATTRRTFPHIGRPGSSARDRTRGVNSNVRFDNAHPPRRWTPPQSSMATNPSSSPNSRCGSRRRPWRCHRRGRRVGSPMRLTPSPKLCEGYWWRRTRKRHHRDIIPHATLLRGLQDGPRNGQAGGGVGESGICRYCRFWLGTVCGHSLAGRMVGCRSSALSRSQ